MKFLDLRKIITGLDVVLGSENAQVDLICDLDLLKEDGLLFIKNKKFLDQVLESKLPSLSIILNSKLAQRVEELKAFNPSCVALTENIDLDLSKASKIFYDKKFSEQKTDKAQVSKTAIVYNGAHIGHDVLIGENVIIHPGCVVMDHCEIAEGSVLFPNSTIYPFVKIGKNVRIHAGSVIGADGFGYNYDEGSHHKIWHMGGVEIQDDVEIGANSQIDGGTFSPTLIGEGSKIDNNVQIGHNCRLGRGVLICGHVAIGGSSKLGDFTVFGGKSGMGDNMKLGAACQVAGGALVNTDWPNKTVLGGHPARPLKEWMRGIAFVRKESLKK